MIFIANLRKRNIKFKLTEFFGAKLQFTSITHTQNHFYGLRKCFQTWNLQALKLSIISFRRLQLLLKEIASKSVRQSEKQSPLFIPIYYFYKLLSSWQLQQVILFKTGINSIKRKYMHYHEGSQKWLYKILKFNIAISFL